MKLASVTNVNSGGSFVAYNVASYAGAWLGGAGTGFVIAKNSKAAITGGLTTSGVWAVATGLANAQTNNGFLTTAYIGFGALSVYLAWKR